MNMHKNMKGSAAINACCDLSMDKKNDKELAMTSTSTNRRRGRIKGDVAGIDQRSSPCSSASAAGNLTSRRSPEKVETALLSVQSSSGCVGAPFSESRHSEIILQLKLDKLAVATAIMVLSSNPKDSWKIQPKILPPRNGDQKSS